jgi:hypothetical protein
MTRFLSHWPVALVFVIGCAVALLLRPAAWTADAVKPDSKAVARTREVVRMLDDMHKGYVVHITDT